MSAGEDLPSKPAAAGHTDAGQRRLRVLALHADYRCRNAGACCSSGWEIPVEEPLERRLRDAGADGRLRLPGAAGGVQLHAGLDHAFAPLASGPLDGARSALGRDGSGACVFLEAPSGLCAIHRQLGEGALPAACRQFPRIATLAPGAVSLTLSHYCPTAAALLFRPDTPADRDAWLTILDNPAALATGGDLEGLDARRGFPLLRPGVLMSWAAFEAWEAHAVATLARHGPPERALDRLRQDAERLRAWTPAAGRFDDQLERVLAGDGTGPVSCPSSAVRPTPSDAWAQVAATVSPQHPRPADPLAAAPATDRRAIEDLVDAGWDALASPIRRWLAAKAFASWLALQGQGVRSHVLGLQTSLAVLRAETLRGCGAARRALDGELLLQSVRRADLLLLHLADPEALAQRVSRCERGAC